jgi:hypothetical protein
MTEDCALLLDVGSSSTRRRVLLASLLSVPPPGLSVTRAAALNPSETQITLPDQIKWTAWTGGPPNNGSVREGPKVCRLSAGGRRIRTLGPVRKLPNQLLRE